MKPTASLVFSAVVGTGAAADHIGRKAPSRERGSSSGYTATLDGFQYHAAYCGCQFSAQSCTQRELNGTAVEHERVAGKLKSCGVLAVDETSVTNNKKLSYRRDSARCGHSRSLKDICCCANRRGIL